METQLGFLEDAAKDLERAFALSPSLIPYGKADLELKPINQDPKWEYVFV